MELLYVFLIVILILLGFIFIKQYFYVMNIESFGDFSPYEGNQQYPFVYQKALDNKAFLKTLNKWESPFNCNDEGYWKGEPTGNPPLVPIYSYDNRHEVRFPYPYKKIDC